MARGCHVSENYGPESVAAKFEPWQIPGEDMTGSFISSLYQESQPAEVPMLGSMLGNLGDSLIHPL